MESYGRQPSSVEDGTLNEKNASCNYLALGNVFYTFHSLGILTVMQQC